MTKASSDNGKSDQPNQFELRRTTSGGTVSQQFSHGRLKSVEVEVKKKRVFKRGAEGKIAEVKAKLPGIDLPPLPTTPSAPSKSSIQTVKEGLSEVERSVRSEAIEKASQGGEEASIAPPPVPPTPLPPKKVTETERPPARRTPPRPRADAPAPSGGRPPREARARAPTSHPRPAPSGPTETPERARKPRKTKRDNRKQQQGRPEQQRRRSGKITVQQALDDTERQRSLASVRRAREKERQAQKKADGGTPQKVVREVVIPEAITVQDLANRMAIRSAEVVKTLMSLDIMATVTQAIDAETAELVATELGHPVKRVSAADVEIGLKAEQDDEGDLQARWPVVTVMGHVDHGKTSLLDAIREADVAAKEAGGITQHVGAYQVETKAGGKITFIDTPGHSAFTAMRARGADVTDIVVLVVAADDGVMAQTIEAAQHARAAGKPIVLAINKTDMPNADPNKVKQQLVQHELVTEDMGGDIIAIEVSATKKTNIDRLEEAILLQAEIADLKANPDRSAEGVVIEARLDRGRGVVATLMVQRGTLRVGDIVVAGSKWGRVRALSDDRGRKAQEAFPSMPVEMLGLSQVPSAGDEFVVVHNEARAREVSEYRERLEKQKRAAILAKSSSVEDLIRNIGTEQKRQLSVIIKADAHGSLQAIASALGALGTEEVGCQILLEGVGAITESDVTLAAATPALVIGFNVRADAVSRQQARSQGVDVRYYALIHDLIDDVRSMLSDLLAPAVREEFLGYARVKQVFRVSKLGNVAGCEITEGTVKRGAKVRLLRDAIVIYEGSLSTLKRFKDDVKEVRSGTECGMSLEKYDDLRENDMIECYEMHEERRTLETAEN